MTSNKRVRYAVVGAGNIAQVAVLLFHVIVERPHYRELVRRRAAMPTATERN